MPLFLILLFCDYFSSGLAWLEVYQLLWYFDLLKVSAFYFIDYPYHVPAFNVIEILQFYCFFPSDCSNLQFFLFLLPHKVQDKFIDLRTFFFTNIYIQCYNFICKDCFSCILQLLMLCFHLVQIIIIFYVEV